MQQWLNKIHKWSLPTAYSSRLVDNKICCFSNKKIIYWLFVVILGLGFACPFYCVILFWAWRRSAVKPTMRQILFAMAAGTLSYYLCALLDFTGLLYITAQLERLLLFTYPAFVIIFGALFFGGTITKGAIAAILIAYSGLAIVFTGGQMTQSANLWLGSGLIIACAIIFALFQLIAKTFIDQMGSSLFTCLSMLGGLSAIIVHFTIGAMQSGGIVAALSIPNRIYIIAAMIAIFSTVLPSFFVNFAIGRIGAQKVAVMAMIGPLVTIAAAIFILKEPFGLWDGLGTMVTLSGIALYLFSDSISVRVSRARVSQIFNRDLKQVKSAPNIDKSNKSD